MASKFTIGQQMTSKEIEDFEEDIAACFNRAEIKAPIHLDNGNIENLVKIFKNVRETDWICCSWRSHAKQLLKGVPTYLLKTDILAGKSISLSYPEYRTISSGIVGGIIPIALGIALANKLNGESARTWCFLGEHTAETGTFLECYNYSMAHDLDIMWVIEDNGHSVCTPTEHVWKRKIPKIISDNMRIYSWNYGLIYDFIHKFAYFKYKSKWPHAGCGKRIQF